MKERGTAPPPRSHALRGNALLATLCVAASCLAETSVSLYAAAVDEPPIIGQPEHFSGAVGVFQISTRVAATEVSEGDAVPFRVRISSKGTARQGPTRPNLRQLKSFKNRFFIQDMPALDRVSQDRTGQAWEFQYQLRPRSLEVHEVPPLPFVFYKPGVIPASKGYWTTAAPAIPLSVMPRGKATLVDADGKPIRPPQRLYHFISGSAVLSRDTTPSLPGPFALALYALSPLTLCLLWYWAWRRQHPDAVHLSRIRRSLAPRRALRALSRIQATDGETLARQATETVAAYLWDRFEMPAQVSAPAELVETLTTIGCPKPLVDRVATFVGACDAARYAPGHQAAPDLVRDAVGVVHALEEWQPPSATPPAGVGVALLFAALVPLVAGAYSDNLTRAEQAFRAGIESAGTPQEKGHFRHAASLYEELRQRGADNPALALNEGNAAMLADDLPRAILAYRRGLRLDPGHRDLQANLAHARDQVVRSTTETVGRPPVDHWPPGLPYPSLRVRLLSTLIVYLIGCAAFTRFVMMRQGKLLTVASLAGVLTLIGVLSIAHEARRQRLDAEQPLVVIAADQVILRKGNGDSYPPRHDIPLNRGAEARVLFQRGGWLQIEFANGDIGWVPRGDALIDQ